MRNGLLDRIMPAVTHLSDGGIIWIITALILMFPAKTRKYGIQMAAALIIGALICNVTLKPLIGRIRPFELTDAVPLIPQPADFSFPSGHTSSSFAGSSALLFASANKKFSIAALILAVLISFSRLYVYVHYPTDVLAGILIGIFSGYTSNKIYKKISCRR